MDVILNNGHSVIERSWKIYIYMSMKHIHIYYAPSSKDERNPWSWAYSDRA
jgi:hypothetical protein